MTIVIGNTNEINSLELLNQTQTKKNNSVKLDYKDDSFEKTKDGKEDKSNNGKFDLSECAKNFIKGVISPVTAVIKHPVMTIGVVAATAVMCSLVPAVGPALGIGFGALSAFQLGKGIYDVAKNYKNGEYDKAEKSFNEIGQGTSGVAMSALGLKQSAKVAKEAKLMNELGVTSLEKAQKEAIALEVKNGSYIDALKETVSLYTTKTGLKAVGAQFKPSNITQRAEDTFAFLFKKQEVTKIKKKMAKFKDTPEYQRRANLSSDEIKAQVEALYNEACDEYGIPKELRPKIEVYSDDANPIFGGGYMSSEHTIKINESSYRNGAFDLPDIIKHETTHANEAILRQRLPMDEKEQLAKEYLLDKIMNGDKENVITGEGNWITGQKTIKPPKMNSQMRKDFANLAKSKLYQTSTTYTDEEIAAMVRPLVEANPEFVQGYNNVDDAVNALSQYAQCHNARYKIALDCSAGFNTKDVDTSFLQKLSAEEKQAAIKSYLDGIDCIESNGANSKGILGFGGDFDQYQFTSEEVLAQQKGNKFELAKLEAKLAKLRSTENYDLSEEARLLDQIKKYQLNIEYKTKGQEMYKLYTESLNHPENKKLAKQVSAMKNELSKLDKAIKAIDYVKSDSCVGTNSYIMSNDYIPYQVKVRPDTGASVYIPYSTTEAADIIADNLKKE